MAGDVLQTNELTDDDPSDYGALRPGKRLGRYELLVPVARGGMARVWAARQHGQRGFQKLVAIKTILPNLAEEPEFERMFLDEARIASGVHHPNVCEIYELGEEKKTLYLAMEWVSGDSLSRVLRPTGKQTEALDPRIVARILADACAGVHAAHELADDDGRQLGVVHRDLSPHNVLLSADGLTKVCDFGVAKALGQLHEQTSAGQLKGKLAYMAPEQISGAAIDRRSDVFALGCVLYEATTGVRPFKGERDYLIMQAVMSGEVEPPSKIVRGYPPELERIVLRALSQQPILRYPTAERMRYALEEFLTKGQLVTQSNVAQAVRSRIGDIIERRKERIKQASSAAEQGSWDPSNAQVYDRSPEAVEHRSGVKSSRREHAAEVVSHPPPDPSASLETDATLFGHQLRDSSTALLPHPMASSDEAGPCVAADLTATIPEPPPPGLPASPGTPIRTPPMGLPAPSVPPATEEMRGSSPVAVPPVPAEPVGAAQYALAALVGVLVAVIIGVGAFYVWTSRTTAAAAPVAAPPVPPPTTSLMPAPAPPLVFQTTPDDATVAVDGIELAAGTRSIPRPSPGRTVTVVLKAKGYDDASVQVDYFTATPMVIALKPIVELDAPAGSAGAAPSASASGTGAKPHPPRPKAAAPVLPDNPY